MGVLEGILSISGYRQIGIEEFVNQIFKTLDINKDGLLSRSNIRIFVCFL